MRALTTTKARRTEDESRRRPKIEHPSRIQTRSTPVVNGLGSTNPFSLRVLSMGAPLGPAIAFSERAVALRSAMTPLFHFRKLRETRTLHVRTIACALAVSVSAQAASVQSPPQSSTSARLQIRMTVVPVVQTRLPVASIPASDSIIYRLETPPLAQTYEFHNLPPQQQNPRAKPAAVLKTPVIVPR